MRISGLISPNGLAAALGEPRVRVVDVRSSLDDEDAGERAYREGHIPGAVYLDWLRDLSDPHDPVPGQIAPPARFADSMGRAGIGDDTLVVAYDDNLLFTAARLAWCLRYYGHDNVRVLDGGLPRWIREGRELTREWPSPPPREFTPRPQPGLRRTKDDVLELVRGGRALLDCRMDATWAQAGAHIPGAKRLPAPSLLEEDGAMRSAASIRGLARAIGIELYDPVVLYCGAGVSASEAFLALSGAGFHHVSVYDGSWSEWAADDSVPKAHH
jgi:thiosulfate/3-mercaptopyruvate sulfurtransferase